MFRFLTQVLPNYSEIQQADDGVWYIFPLPNSLNKEQDLNDVNTRIDQFLLDSQWKYKENPMEAQAIKTMKMKKEKQLKQNNDDNNTKSSKSKRAKLAS